MPEDQNKKIKQLLHKIDNLEVQQRLLQQQLANVRQELNSLRTGSAPGETASLPPPPEKRTPLRPQVEQQPPARKKVTLAGTTASSDQRKWPGMAAVEAFIGENLINKIGILILLAGVVIGGKYAIDNQLVSPLMRILLGYLTGAALLGFAIWLKKQYHAFSAVLLSGAMAIFYFITFAAYDFYGLLPQTFSFALMALFTVFTVVAALHYNLQVIAAIGLVGAYGVPFLLSDGSGRAEVLFSYMAIINTGIMAIAWRKYWKAVYYLAFYTTWLIYGGWHLFNYNQEQHLAMAFVFLGLFFALFYLTFLAYKLLKKEKYAGGDLLYLLTNAFVFFGFGYAMLEELASAEQWLGLFTLGNALLHFAVGVLLYRKKLGDSRLFYLVAGLVLVFVTLAVPVQLDGNWVTLLWGAEAVLVFWLGRSQKISVYEKFSYILMVLSIGSLLHDYDAYHMAMSDREQPITPLLNVWLLNGLLTSAFFGVLAWLHLGKRYPQPAFYKKVPFFNMLGYGIPLAFVLLLYQTFRLEVKMYWQQRFLASKVAIGDTFELNYPLYKFSEIWQLNYSLGFCTLLLLAAWYLLKNRQATWFAMGCSALALLAFVSNSLLTLSELRETYLAATPNELFERGQWYLNLRYVSIAFVAILLLALVQVFKKMELSASLRATGELLLHLLLLWVVSSELLHLLSVAGYSDTWKLGLSILWGSYSLLLIALGIWQHKKHLRLAAMGLFAVTLGKLFFYDIAALGTGQKTIVFVALGVLLLIISFLYNKYKNLIADETSR